MYNILCTVIQFRWDRRGKCTGYQKIRVLQSFNDMTKYCRYDFVLKTNNTIELYRYSPRQ